MGGERQFPQCSGFQFGLVLLNIQKSLIVLENALRFNYKHTIFSAEHERIFKPTFLPTVAATHDGLSPVLKMASPPSVVSRCSILRQPKTVMCSSDVKWERGQVNHRVKEIKDDGRTAV